MDDIEVGDLCDSYAEEIRELQAEVRALRSKIARLEQVIDRALAEPDEAAMREGLRMGIEPGLGP